MVNRADIPFGRIEDRRDLRRRIVEDVAQQQRGSLGGRECFQCLKKGGLEIGGKKPDVNLWSVLNRASDTFILVPKAG